MTVETDIIIKENEKPHSFELSSVVTDSYLSKGYKFALE